MLRATSGLAVQIGDQDPKHVHRRDSVYVQRADCREHALSRRESRIDAVFAFRPFACLP